MAGLTNSGLEINRLEDVITSLNTEATTIFQDLVPDGDIVDTSESSTIGRIIGVTSPSYADIWEAIEQVNNAFNPNTATGIALDNIVFIGGLVREVSSPTTAYCLMSGDYLTVIPSDSVVSSLSTSQSYLTTSSLTLNQTSASGVTLSVSAVTNSATYIVQAVSDSATRTFTYTADSNATLSEILNGLSASVASVGSSLFISTVDVDTITISSINKLTKWNFSLTGSLAYSKISKIVEVVADEDGPVEQPSNTITTIQTPILGWDSVTNPYVASIGRDRETDEELRLRFSLSKYVRGSNISDALYSDLLALPGVEDVIVLVNDTESTDSNSIPPHGFMAVVLGGVSTDIAEIIWQNKPAGIVTYGDVSSTITDAQGLSKTVYFKRPTDVPIYIDIALTDIGTFPDNGETLIKEALVQYFIDNFTIGDDIIYSRLYSPINNIEGHYITSLEIGTSPSPSGTTNITIANTSRASLESININITVS